MKANEADGAGEELDGPERWPPEALRGRGGAWTPREAPALTPEAFEAHQRLLDAAHGAAQSPPAAPSPALAPTPGCEAPHSYGCEAPHSFGCEAPHSFGCEAKERAEGQKRWEADMCNDDAGDGGNRSESMFFQSKNRPSPGCT